MSLDPYEKEIRAVNRAKSNSILNFGTKTAFNKSRAGFAVMAASKPPQTVKHIKSKEDKIVNRKFQHKGKYS